MDRGYESFCLADRHFYDAPECARGDDVDFEAAAQPVPDGWKRGELDDWLVYWPDRADLPSQGWKAHVSACLDNANEVLTTVREYCLARGVAFKFVRSRQLLLMRNGKYADRGASGKFITIFPADDAQLEVVLHDLGELLAGQPGPYILSDLRWGEGPLYVRYGGFAERFCPGRDGQLELAIETPDGELVPDRRDPFFAPPPWVTMPPFLEPHLQARRRATVADVPYRFQQALHFSNGGGIYAAEDERTGQQLVLKEARPHAGLDLTGVDAVTRLVQEATTLRLLEDLDVAPAVHDEFVLGDHRFLAMEYVEGSPLRSLMAERLPLAQEDPGADAVADYARWALHTMELVEAAVSSVHARGLVIGDLHPDNVLVRPDGRITLIDLEVAAPVAQAGRQALADPHFVAPAGVSGFDIDRYSLACLRLFLFMPLTALIPLAPGKAQELADAIAEVFPVPQDYLDGAVRTITAAWRSSGAGAGPARRAAIRLEPDHEGWLRARDSLSRAILASATPDRSDRLFPGDVAQFSTGGLNLAHGAAGVLLALFDAGVGRFPDHESWLVRRATSPEPGAHLGFYDGLHGVAYALMHLGRHEDALKVLDICRHELAGALDRVGLDLLGGLAGIGLNLAHAAELTGDTLLWDEAVHVGEVLAGRLGEAELADTSGGDHPYAGLVRGSSGPALLFLRLHDHTGEGRHLDLAHAALAQDLRRCVVREEDGSLEVNEGWRTMPYLADGSVGVGIVLQEYLSYRPDEVFAERLSRIDRAAKGQFYAEPGLFHGRAGMIAYLAARRGSCPGAADAIAGHVRRLNWHALGYQGDLAFPGEELMRLSMDLATGSAGVLLALGAGLGGVPVGSVLPFTRSPDQPRATTLGPTQLEENSIDQERGGEHHVSTRPSEHADQR